MRLRLVMVVGGLVLATAGVWRTGYESHAERPASVQAERLDDRGTGDDELVSLADASVTTSAPPGGSRPASGAIALQVPDDPLPGQLRAPCRRRGVVAINGGCWILWTTLSPPCDYGAYEWKEACYWPIYVSGRPPTS